MKRIILVCLTILFLLPALSRAGIIGPANIRHIDGDVMFRTPDDDEWLPASINTPLDEGDAVWCPDGSRVEIQLPDGSMLRMDDGSQLDLIANEDGFVHVHLASGRLYLRTAQTIAKDSLQIDADDTSVLPASRTRLRLDMLPNSQEDVAIFKGSAYVEGNGSRTRVRAGELIALEEGHNEIMPLNPSDDWEDWNMDRDRQQSRSAAIDSNLPDELRSHAADLDANGTWVQVPEYGTVWRPTVLVSADWAPYREGRWIWKNGDYVWISYERWGWVPYHYGRWAVVAGFGWCWVPPARGDIYWGPGYVGWYSTGSHVGWTPLAPGETFYGKRYYGRHSAIVTSVRVNPSTIEYRNRHKPGGLTIVQHNDFQRGRIVVQQPSRSPSVSVSVSIGAPQIRPLRESRMPIIKQTPPRVAPPRLEGRDRRDLRERFPRISTDAAKDRRRQPQPHQSTAPVAPRHEPVVKEKRTVLPATGAEGRGRGKDKGVMTPLPNSSRERDEKRQRPTVQQPAPVSPPPAVSVPPRSEPPRRDTVVPAPPSVSQPQPERDRSKRNEQRQRPSVQQSTPPAAPPTAPVIVPSRSEPQRRDNTPSATPAVRQPQPDRDRPKRDEQQQRPSVQQPTLPAAPPTAPVIVPSRSEPQRRDSAPSATPAVRQPQPDRDRPKRDEQQRPSVQQPLPQPAPQPAPARQIEPRKSAPPVVAPPEPIRQRGDRSTDEGRDKKVWKVTTPEGAGDRDPRERGRKER